MPKMTGAKFLAETLNAYNVTHFFFMPVIIPEAMPELERLGIKRIMAHAEKSAAYMADGYARVAKKAGICGAQSVGGINLAAGLQDAYLACSPTIALTGRLPQIQQNRNAYQEVDHINPFSAVTKFNTFVTTAEELPLALRQAFRESTSGTPGPSHIDLQGITGEIITEIGDFEIIAEKQYINLPPFRPEPELSAIIETIKLLSEAKKPVIIAGGGTNLSGARNELIILAEKLQIPVATSLNAKEVFPYDHPLAIGVPGTYSRACTNKIISESDLVFFIGSHTGSQVTNNWNLPKKGTTVIQLDINPSELGRSYPITLGLQGDVKNSLAKIISNTNQNYENSKWVNYINKIVKDWKIEMSPLLNSEEIPMRPERLCKELTSALPDDAILVSDTGHSGIWTGAIMDLKHQKQSYIRCAGSLGWALPASIGAKCAAPDRPVICFTGDGGAWYHLTELETAVRNNINTIWVINNNSSLNQERHLNEEIYGGPKPGSDQLWKFNQGNFSAIAKLLGCTGIEVNKPSEIASAIEKAIESGKPSVIDVKTNIDGIAPVAWNG
ncbi:MAG: acetolactate synthase [Chloroflexi bacterium]|nr:acetolactate synthase [Chloroflexota bacterium]|tara:strand:- start:4983 stop:6650 length:1668 start_codon:yes stop_codon:yes gene_type:complete